MPGLHQPPLQPSDGPAGPGRVRLVVVYGGQSAEHEVSCISAFHVARAADPSRYDVQLVGITRTGRWVDAGAALQPTGPGQTSLPSPDTLVQRGVVDPPSEQSALAGDSASGGTAASRSHVASVAFGGDSALDSVARLSHEGDLTAGPVVVFPLLHGPKGEDGTVQGLLEVAGLPYVGPGVAGSAASMDKGMTKAILAAAGLPQVRALVLREHELDELTAKRVEAELGWPVFVKPANLGSSIGITLVRDSEELAGAIILARHYDEWIVIEERVDAREIEVGVLGIGADMQASVPGEVIPGREFYDFEDKYGDGGAVSRIPADLPADVAAEARCLALKAAHALRIDGMARVDFFYEAAGRGLLVNEVNTIPGFTPISQYPQLWAASGVDYPSLVDELVRLALVRHERRSQFEVRRLLP
jgi:D-alanine-D-alanine ligase